jgi:hypothetical protein
MVAAEEAEAFTQEDLHHQEDLVEVALEADKVELEHLEQVEKAAEAAEAALTTEDHLQVEKE